MSPLCDQQQSANVALMRHGHVACFSDVYYPTLRHIVANKGDNLNRGPVFGKQTRKWQKKNRKKMLFSQFQSELNQFYGKLWLYGCCQLHPR